MNEAIREAFVPKNLQIEFWKEIVCKSVRSWNTFILHQELNKDLKCESIVIKSMSWELVDTIEREIDLKKGDILHFEYKVNVKFW